MFDLMQSLLKDSEVHQTVVTMILCSDEVHMLVKKKVVTAEPFLYPSFTFSSWIYSRSEIWSTIGLNFSMAMLLLDLHMYHPTSWHLAGSHLTCCQ